MEMKTRHFMAATTILFLLLVSFYGCVHRTPVASPQPPAEPPAPLVIEPQPVIKIDPQLPSWAAKGSGAYREGAERYFYGVGVAASGSGNRVLMRTAAANQARNELRNVLRRYLTALTGRPVSGTPGDDGQETLEPIVLESLNSATIVDHWTDPRDGRLYALCRLDLTHLKENLARTSLVDPSLRNAWLNSADRQHGRMAGPP